MFLARFTLTDQEERALSSRDVPVGASVFRAMDKAAQIRQDCLALLSDADDREGGTAARLGLDLMESTATSLDAAYDKLHKWAAFQCRGYASDALEVSGVMRETVDRLRRHRPDLLQDTLDLLSSTRSSALAQLFLDALTRGGPGGLPRPIELVAHDPTRYVGDMLAWVHQTMATEREFLESLFGLSVLPRHVGSARVHPPSSALDAADLDDSLHASSSSSYDVERAVRAALDRNMSTCARPLKVRVLQTVRSQEGAILSYRIAALVHFYKVTTEKTFGSHAGMVKVIAESVLLVIALVALAKLTSILSYVRQDHGHCVRDVLQHAARPRQRAPALHPGALSGRPASASRSSQTADVKRTVASSTAAAF